MANSFVPGRGALSGGFIHVLNVAAAWRRYDVVVFAPEDARSTVAERLPAARFVAARPRKLPGQLARMAIPSLIARLFGTFLVRDEIGACDAVVASTTFLADVVPMIFARRGRSALIIQHLQTPPWRRAGAFAGNAAAFLTERLGLAIAARCAKLVFVNERRTAARAGIPEHTAVAVITHGVDHIPDVAPNALERRAGAVFVGRLHPTKGLDELLEAWRFVCAEMPGTPLVLVGAGDPAYRSRLERACASLGIDGAVQFRGAVDTAGKIEALRNARVFAFPSHEEGWGIAIAEAMRAGTPCVTYDLAAYESVFTQGRTFVRCRDVANFAREILRLLGDDERWRRLSAEATELANAFTWPHAAAIYERALDRLMR